MREHDEVEATVPGRQPGVEGHEQSVRIGTAVDEQPPAAIALDEYRVPLADVQDGDPDPAVRPVRCGDPDPCYRGRESERDEATDPAASAPPATGRP